MKRLTNDQTAGALILAEIMQESMAAAGLDRDADPRLLPERISEVRFLGPLYVPSGPYPRRERLKATESKPRNLGRTGVASLGRVG